MNAHCVFDPQGVAAGKRHHHRDVAGPRHAEHKLIAALEALDRKRETPELIFTVGVGTRNVADQFGLELTQPGT